MQKYRKYSANAWQKMDQDALNAAYNNSAAVTGSDAIIADWGIRSAAIRAEFPDQLNLRYGVTPRNTIDFLSAGKGTPLLVFFPGGNWQSLSKDDFTFSARGPLAHGISVAVVGYTLAPESSLDTIVEECRQALTFVTRELTETDDSRQPLWVAGWSAGAHIAAMMLDTDGVSAGLAISGVYDLEPIRHTYINDKLGLSIDAADRNSPALHIPTQSSELLIAAGENELPEWRRQSQVFAERRTAAGLPGRYLEIPAADHFTIMDKLSDPQGRLCTELAVSIKLRNRA